MINRLNQNRWCGFTGGRGLGEENEPTSHMASLTETCSPVTPPAPPPTFFAPSPSAHTFARLVRLVCVCVCVWTAAETLLTI